MRSGQVATPTSPVRDPRREPALWIALVASAIQLGISFVPGLSPTVQGLVNAVIAAVAGFAVAEFVNREGQVPTVVGLVQAILALAIGLGLAISSAQQALIMTLVNAVAALFVRTQVEAKIDQYGRPRTPEPPGGPSTPVVGTTPAP